MSLRTVFGAVFPLAFMLGCHSDPQAPNHEIAAQQCLPETCGGGGGGGGGYPTTDPAPDREGIWVGANVGLSRCYDPTGMRVTDVDQDHFEDWCEQWIAYTFRPMLRPNRYDCDLRTEPAYGVKYFPSTGIIRIAYLFSYYEDCGNDFYTGCSLSQPWTGDCRGHEGDSEFMILDLRYNASIDHYVVDRAFMSAHFGSGGESSTNTPYYNLEYPVGGKYQGYPRVWVARGKHGNYPTMNRCNSGGAVGSDSCEANFTDTRMEFIFSRNVGSAVHHMLNCTLAKPEMQYFRPGTECYWDGYDPNQSPPPKQFFGWWWQDGANPYSGGATSYGTILRVAFEPTALPPTLP
jgi:hypothetical protein